jgi:hypothetical protein
MAVFIAEAEYEIREPIHSDVLTQLRALPSVSKFSAFSLKYRHPRIKQKFAKPSFCATFSMDGTRYSEIAESLEALDAELIKLYLHPITA